MEYFVLSKNTFVHCEDKPVPTLRRSMSLGDLDLTELQPVYHVSEDIAPDQKLECSGRDSLSSVSTSSSARMSVTNLVKGECNEYTFIEAMENLSVGRPSWSSITDDDCDDIMFAKPAVVELPRPSADVIAKENPIADSERTTVMVRNIPCRYNQEDLMAEVAMMDLPFNFLYLPPARKSPGNLGYCFINFVEPQFAEMFINLFKGHAFPAQPNSTKRAEPCYATMQGFEQNVAYYSGLKVSKNKQFRPFIERQ